MAMNEATLESRLDRVLATVFPTFKEVKVLHQKSFSIKFGHHNVEVDLKEPSSNPSRAIFDILLTIADRNVILLELKREGLKLTPDDVSQGISYARLAHPMPPLTLVSNGLINEFYNTYTKEKIDTASVDMDFIQRLTDNSFYLATKDFKDAVNLLLNREPELFSKIINQITETKFERMLGGIDDFTKPLCSDFLIERHNINKVISLFEEGSALVGVIGSAFAGKTNLLYQFFLKVKSDKNFLLYLDCNDHNYSIFQQLANHFTVNAKISITKDKIREWLINSLTDLPEGKFYLLIDNFNGDIPEAIKSEIIELIDIFKGVNHHTLYTLDEFNYKKIAYVENRQYKTIIGEQSKLIQLDELNDDEYNATNDLLYNEHRIAIEHGGHYTPEYREPRILRHLLSLYGGDIEDGEFIKIDAVPNMDLLNTISVNKTYTRLVHDLYKKITFCFFAERELRKTDSDLNIMASGSGAVTIDTFKKFFPDDFETLIKSSVVVLREIRNGMTVIYPKFQELIAKHSIPIISKLLIQENEKQNPIGNLCKLLVDTVTPVPYCDVAATGVLMDIAHKDEVDLFSGLVQELLKIPPRFEKVAGGMKALMYSEGIGHVEIDFEDNMEEGGFVADFLPYAILSQIAAYPLRLVGDKKHTLYAFHLYLIYEVGSSKEFLRRADVRSLQNMKPLETFDLEGHGHFISGHQGVIEPIVQSIQKCFLTIPEEIERLYERGFERNNINLLYRIYLALRTLTNYTDPKLAATAENYVKRFNKYFKAFMADLLSSDVENPQKREIQRARLSSIMEKKETENNDRTGEMIQETKDQNLE